MTKMRRLTAGTGAGAMLVLTATLATMLLPPWTAAVVKKSRTRFSRSSSRLERF